MNYTEFCQQFNISLNPQQAQAVQHTKGSILLLAVPGSGKTTALVARLGYMIHCLNVPPERILTMTYTVSAAKDMKERFSSIFGNEYAARLQFRTINGVCASIIYRYVKDKNTDGFDLIENNAKILTEIYRKLRNDYPTDGEIKDIQKQISYIKNMRLSREEIEDLEIDGEDIATIYNEYIAQMKQRQLMDYDDQLVYAYNIFKSRPDILEYYRKLFPYLCVDEAQDTSKIQHMIIRLLAGNHGKVFMVGDEDQSIYGFRAAYPDALMAFEKDYPNSAVLLLEENYRSSPEIVSAASRFISLNTMRRKKNMHTSKGAGVPVRKASLVSRAAQYSYIAKMAESEPKQELAVLYRNNDSSVPLIDYLHRNNISYQLRQTDAVFFTNRTVSGVRDIMTLALSPLAESSFMNVYYKFNLPISKLDAESAVRFAKVNKCPSLIEALMLTGRNADRLKGKLTELKNHFKALKAENPADALKRIRYQMGYGAYLMKNGGDDERLYLLSLLATRENDIPSFLKRLDALKSIVEAGGDKNSKLILSTIHSSKGLEYERVAIIDAIEGMLPSITPIPNQPLDDLEKALLEEERRLFYVAATRAKRELLFMTYERAAKSIFVEQFCGVSTSKIFASGVTARPTGSDISQKTKMIAKDFIAGSKVLHRDLGAGEIAEKNGEIVTITFASGIQKRFQLLFCVENNILSLIF